MNRIIFLISFLLSFSIFAQQNEDFAKVKKYYDYQRFMIGKELRTKFEKETNTFEKTKIQNSFLDFMKKVDSMENNTYIKVLIITKNKEDLGEDFPKEIKDSIGDKTIGNPPPPRIGTNSKIKNQDPDYPGGIDQLREEIVSHFYLKGIKEELEKASATVQFIVEKNGSITHVKAEGEDHGFNTQSEIAVYRLTKKFIPAILNGKRVRYRFRIPITMHFE